MGRPLNSNLFGSATGTSIKVRAKIGSASEGYGTIVKQLSDNTFLVTVGSDTGPCTLADKNNGSLVAGDMTILATDSGSTTYQVMKIAENTVTLDTGVSSPWSFATAVSGVVQLASN
jgi:hypothetical protein